MKPKIALVIDVYGWVFDHTSQKLKKHLDSDYDIHIIPLEEVCKEVNVIAAFCYLKQFDLVYFFWRGQLLWPFYDEQRAYLKKIGMTQEYFIKKYIKPLCITTSVYDHLFLEEDIVQTKQILKYVKGYTVCSKHLKKIYDRLDVLSPCMIITDGVDLSEFYPQKLERFQNTSNRKWVIGWVGNSNWQGDGTEIKGVNTILKPAIEELIQEGYPVERYFADKQENPIPHDEMNAYYSKIDIYICTSLNEGTPNPVLEAAACGVPIISTDVGIISDLFGKKQKKFILKNRNIEDVKKAILELIEHPEQLQELSSENIERIKKWDWKYKAQDFKKFFDQQMKK